MIPEVMSHILTSELSADQRAIMPRHLGVQEGVVTCGLNAEDVYPTTSGRRLGIHIGSQDRNLVVPSLTVEQTT